jgi:hypothetical protein
VTVFGLVLARAARSRRGEGGGAARGQAGPVNERGGSSAIKGGEALTRLGAGRPLGPALANRMTGALGGDFSGVRVHTDPAAAEAAGSVNADAFTVGQHVYFGAGRFQPGAPGGDRLLAHELVHTMQQSGGAPAPQASLTVSQPGDRDEVEAHTLADHATSSDHVVRPASGPGSTNSPVVRRSPRRGSGALRIARSDLGTAGAVSAPPQTEASPVHTGPGWQVLNEVGVVRVEEPSAALRGARLRPEPTDGGPRAAEFVTLPESTHVHVVSQRHEPGNQGWRYVMVTDGPFIGRVGYVKEYLILTGLPDPLAIEYYIATPNERLQWLVENHPHFAAYDIKTGDDARTLAMAVWMANQEHGHRDGVYLNEEKLRAAKDPGWREGTKDKLDEYRRVLRPIFQAVELKHGKKIWLPGPAYVERLKDRDIIPTRPAWKNALVMVGKGVAGFVSGLVQGFVGSFVDLVVGIWDLIKTIFITVRDLFTGELFRKGGEVYDAIEKYLSSKTPGEVLSDLLNALTSAAGEMWTNFVRRWTANNLFDKWNYRGRVIGYLAAEVLMAVFSGGGSLAAKLLSKLGKVGKALQAILTKILGKIDDILDAIPGRKRFKKEADKHGDGKDTEAKQAPFAIAAAAVIAETNDVADMPTGVLKAQLFALKAKYHWITGFGAERQGPNVFTIWMYGSRYLVKPRYTTKVDEPGDAPAATTRPTKQRVNPPPREGPNVPETGRQLEKRVAEVDPPSNSYFGFLGGDRKTFNTLVKEVKEYQKKFQSGIKLRNSGVLGESAREVIDRNRRLKELWAMEEKPYRDELERLTKAMRDVRGDQRTSKVLEHRYDEVQKKLTGLTDWANGVVGKKRPDIVEFLPDERVVAVTDITQRPFDPSHNFKTQFYGVVLNRMTGYSVRALDWKGPLVANPLSKFSR